MAAYLRVIKLHEIEVFGKLIVPHLVKMFPEG
jgi:hypothetical protein